MHAPKSIVVVGAGTSGWMMATAIKRHCPDIDVTVIHDSKIPTIGVGETLDFGMPGFIEDYLGLEVFGDWMKDVNATLKTGVIWKDWEGNNEQYINTHTNNWPTNLLLEPTQSTHFASRKHQADLDENDHYGENAGIVDLWYALWRRGDFGNVGIEHLYACASEQYYFAKDRRSVVGVDGKWRTNPRIGTSYHLDAELFGSYIGEKRGRPAGVKTLDDHVVDVIMTQNGSIDYLKTKSGQKITADFYIDCSGFRRLLSKAVGMEWQDMNEYYNNSALVMQTFYSDKDHLEHQIESLTTLGAMKQGWRFGVPLQHRRGNGYVFNDRMITDVDHLADEFTKVCDQDRPQRLIKWQPGHYKSPMKGNCLAVGLSLGFTDPFDANNLAFNQGLIMQFVECLKTSYNNDWNSSVSALIGKLAQARWESINMRVMSGIWFSPRRDTEYWKQIADHVDRSHLKEQYIQHVIDSRKGGRSNYAKFLFKTPALLDMVVRYNMDLPPISIDEDLAEIGKRFFSYNETRGRVAAQQAESLDEYYLKRFGLRN